MLRQKPSPFKKNEFIMRTCAAVAIAAGLFCFILCGLLLLNAWLIRLNDPMNLPELIELRERLSTGTESAGETIETIRQLDLLARGAVFTSQRMLRSGGLLALISAVIFIGALRLAAYFNEAVPEPDLKRPLQKYWHDKERSRELIVFMGGLWLVAALFAAAFTRLDFPEPRDTMASGTDSHSQDNPSEGAALTNPDWEEVQKQWPNFRGPGGIAQAFYTTAPTQWDINANTNVLWKAEVPLNGFNSPVVWDDHIYLSGADDKKREVFCFHTDTGELLWRVPVGPPPNAPLELPKVNDDTGFAAPSVATQGDVVCAIFATGHLACINKDGKIRWDKFLGMPDNHYGHSSSLIIHDNLLIVQYDQRKNGSLYAFHLDTGKEAWKEERKDISWASPILVNAEQGMQLAVVSTKYLDVYAPQSGALLWQVDCLAGEIGPSPGFGAGMYFTANDYADSSAIRPPADPTTDEPEIVWQFYDSLPDISSPLATDAFFYLLTSRGEIICLDPKDGEVVWVHEHDEAFFASAVLVGERIYAIDHLGTVLIFKNAGEYEEIASLSFDEDTAATPAYMDNRLYARTATQLICIASP
ncbi:MAG: PQQ-binding-like beta-propeller repeat protein [Candidatus Hydrogenedentales bacterium]|jgi:outer membrane protein assembly factor BamB